MPAIVLFFHSLGSFGSLFLGFKKRNQLPILFLLVWFNSTSIPYPSFPLLGLNLKVMVTLHLHYLAWTKHSIKVTIFVTIPLLYLYPFPFHFIYWTKRPLYVVMSCCISILFYFIIFWMSIYSWKKKNLISNEFLAFLFSPLKIMLKNVDGFLNMALLVVLVVGTKEF